MLSLFDTSSPAAPSDLSLLRVSRRAMATSFEVMLPVNEPLGLAAANDALDLIDELEDQLTVYRDDSEVSRLNARAASEDVEVEQGLFDLLTYAAALSRETRAAFDIATGALIKTWGFYERSGRVPTVAERKDAMQRTGMRHVILNPVKRTVRYRHKGLEINLGGIGKGYALDRATERLRKVWGVSSGLLHGGTSSVLAVGGPANGERGWNVAVRHPWEAARTLGTVSLINEALGTSAATYQYFEYNGRKLGHLLDPRKGWPAEGVQQVSVIAPSAAEADALSTAFFVMGVEETRIYCQSHPHVSAIVLTQDHPEPVVLNAAPGKWTPAA